MWKLSMIRLQPEMVSRDYTDHALVDLSALLQNYGQLSFPHWFSYRHTAATETGPITPHN